MVLFRLIVSILKTKGKIVKMCLDQLVFPLLKTDPNYQWLALALGHMSLKFSLSTYILSRFLIDFHPVTHLDRYLPILMFYGKTTEVEDNLKILDILINITKQQVDKSVDQKWTTIQQVLGIAKVIMLNNNNDSIKEKLAILLGKLKGTTEGFDVSIRGQADMMLKHIYRLDDPDYNKSQLLERQPAPTIQEVIGPKIVSFNHDLADQVHFCKILNLKLNKSLRRETLGLEDSASALFQLQYVPQKETNFQPEYLPNLSDNPIDRIISDEDLKKLKDSNQSQTISSSQLNDVDMRTIQGMIIPFTLCLGDTLPEGFTQIYNLHLNFGQSPSIKVTNLFPFIPYLSSNIYNLHIYLEPQPSHTAFVPFDLECNASFIAGNNLHYGTVGRFRIEYEDFFLPMCLSEGGIMQEALVDSIRVLYLPSSKMREEISRRLRPFITEEKENGDVIGLIRLFPQSYLKLEFVIKESKSRVLIESDTTDVLNWIDDFFDKWA
ncbi:hypothetical protein FGO68_gene7708 [Halteria grandinella]|uniref:AP-5 complex subunit beta-1 n=1 Tax=Halteria grandinella TaxID=5974 RepID=A0A8J8NY07_HALGN|nr:hypothetical protein FGO68_gene7708 [Halteria grandinella]